MKAKYVLPICILLVAALSLWWFAPLWTTDTKLVVQLTAKDFYKAIGKAAALLAILQFGLTTWLKSRIEESIKHEYAKKLEDYKNDLKIREQAAKVAEFLAFAAAQNADPQRFNEQAWTLSLWLPTETYIQIAKILAGEKPSKDVKEILIDVRKLLLGDKAGSLRAENILHHPKPY